HSRVCQVDWDRTSTNQGQYTLTGLADVTVGGYQLGANFTLTNTQLTAAAALTLPGGLGNVQVSGQIQNNGNLSLSGAATLVVGGFNLSGNATLARTGANVTVSFAGTVALPGGLGNVQVSGEIQNNGNLSLTGAATLVVGGFNLSGNATLARSGANVTVSFAGTVALPGGLGNVQVSGQIQNNGNLSLTGAATLTVGGFNLSGNATLARAGANVTVSF